MDTGLDSAVAPPADQGAAMLQDIAGTFWGVYIGGPWNGARGWTPATVRAYAAAGVRCFLPMYAGQQSGGILAGRQGMLDGEDAARLMALYGWAPNAPCALVVEEHTSAKDHDRAAAYAIGWCLALRNARYSAGVYGSGPFLERLAADAHRPVFAYVRNWVRTRHVRGIDPGRIPGFPPTAFAKGRVWQYAGDPLERLRIRGWAVNINAATIALAPAPGSMYERRELDDGRRMNRVDPGAPEREIATYSVRRGDTLWSIGIAHSVSLAALLAANPRLENHHRVAVGDSLYIPV